MLSTTHVKTRIPSENASFRVDEIIATLLETSPEVIGFLTNKVDWFEALRTLQRRFEQAAYNQDGEAWFFVPRNTPDHKTIERLKVLFPDVVEIATPTVAEVELAYQD